MNELSRSHISHAWLYGPAERTLIEPWLTGHAGLMTNAYPDPPMPDITIPDTIAAIPLPATRQDPTRRPSAMAA